MSAFRPGNMKGPWVRTPLLLLLLLLLLTTLTRTVLCQSDDVDLEDEAHEEVPDDTDDTETPDAFATVSDTTSLSDTTTTEDPVKEEIVEEHGSGSDQSISSDIPDPGDPSTTESVTTTGDDELNLAFIIIPILVALVVVIISTIVCGIFAYRRWNKKTQNQDLTGEDPYLDGSSTEKVPMPMFEEDVPSVLELEMEELDQLMNKDGKIAGNICDSN